MRKVWASYWREQSKPLHQVDNEDFYKKHAAELRLLTGNSVQRAVLEIGCGDGALFRHLGFDNASRYVGFDISPSMLAEFKNREKDVELYEGSATDIRIDGQFDLVFSNGVVQYLDMSEFLRHLKCVKGLLAPGGQYICGSIPAKERFLFTAFGKGGYPPKFSMWAGFKEVGAYLLGRSPLGQWFSLRDIESGARRAGMRANVFGSIHYLYRYHAVFRISEERS